MKLIKTKKNVLEFIEKILEGKSFTNDLIHYKIDPITKLVHTAYFVVGQGWHHQLCGMHLSELIDHVWKNKRQINK